jgi:hypothetical protein
MMHGDAWRRISHTGTPARHPSPHHRQGHIGSIKLGDRQPEWFCTAALRTGAASLCLLTPLVPTVGAVLTRADVCSAVVQGLQAIRHPGAPRPVLPTATVPVLVLLVAGSEKRREAERSSDHRWRVLR